MWPQYRGARGGGGGRAAKPASVRSGGAAPEKKRGIGGKGVWACGVWDGSMRRPPPPLVPAWGRWAARAPR
eukprot:scaffold4300_cov81-Isochrysis_galbana.AAC.1